MGPSVELFTPPHGLPLPLAEGIFGWGSHSGKLGDTLQGVLSHPLGQLGHPGWWQSRAAGAGSLLGSLPPRWDLCSLQSVHRCRLLLLKIFFNVLKKKKDYFVTIIQQRVSVPVENINRLL